MDEIEYLDGLPILPPSPLPNIVCWVTLPDGFLFLHDPEMPHRTEKELEQ